jgi:hypothetical protein
MLVLAVFSGGYLWLTRQTDRLSRPPS